MSVSPYSGSSSSFSYSTNSSDEEVEDIRFTDLDAFEDYLVEDPRILTARDDQGATLLHELVDREEIVFLRLALDYLTQYSLDPNVLDQNFETPLFRAAQLKDTEAFLELKDAGAHLDQRNGAGLTAMQLKPSRDELPFLESLVKRGALNIQDVDCRGNSLLDHAAIQLFNLLDLSQNNLDGEETRALADYYFDEVRRIYDLEGVDSSIMNEHEETAIHTVFSIPFSTIQDYQLERKIEKLYLFLKEKQVNFNGASSRHVDCPRLPFLWLETGNYNPFLRELQDQTVDITFQNLQGASLPFCILAQKSENERLPEIKKTLFERSDSRDLLTVLNQRDFLRQSLVHIAAKNGDTRALLVLKSLCMDSFDNACRNPDHIGRIPHHYAALSNCHRELFELLPQGPVFYHWQDSDGFTPQNLLESSGMETTESEMF